MVYSVYTLNTKREVHAGEYSQTEEPIFSSEYTHLQKEVSGSCCRPNTLWSSLPQSCEPTLRTAESYHSSSPPQTSRCVLFSGSSIVLSSERLAFYSLRGTTHHACRWNKVLHKGPGGARDKMPLPKYRVRVNIVAAHKGSGVRVQGSGLILNGLRKSASENWCYWIQ